MILLKLYDVLHLLQVFYLYHTIININIQQYVLNVLLKIVLLF